MTNNKWQRLSFYLPILAILAVLVLFTDSVGVLAAGSTELSTAVESSEPATIEESDATVDSSDPVQDPNSPSEDTKAPEKYIFSNGTITGISEAYLDSLAQSGSSVDLTIPAEIDGVSVTAIGDQAFRLDRYASAYPALTFRNLDLSQAPLTSIGQEAFYGCSGLTGVLKLPETVTTIGTQAFFGTGFSTVYLPASLSSCGSSAFDAGPVLVFPNKGLFEQFASAGITTDWKRAGYPINLTFQNVNGSITERQVLYQLPINFHRNTRGAWVKDASWKLPEIPDEAGYSSCRWVFDPSSDSKGVSESTPVTGDTLYAVRDIASPEISFSEDINITYDGKAHTLSVTASHPLYSAADTASEGNVLFYYTWSWEENGRQHEQKGYDLSSLSFTEACGISVSVQVEAQVKAASGENNTVLSQESHTWKVQITEPETSEPTETPEPSEPTESTEPEIPSEPEDTAEPSGSDDSSDFIRQLEISCDSGGTVDPKGRISIEEDSRITFSFSPDPGFRIGEVKLDDVDITSQVKENSYILEADSLSGDNDTHTLSVSFRRLSKTELQQLFKELPSLTEGTDCDADTEAAYLNAWVQYQALKKSSGLTLDDGILQNYYKSLSYLPCIRLSINVDEKAKDFVSIPDASVVLSSLTQEEAQKLLDGKITRISFQLKAVPYEISETAEKAVLSLLDQAVLMDSFRISVSKTVQTPGASNTYDWSLTEQPLTLRFSFSKAGQPADGYERTFHIAALKDGSDGKPEAQLLETKTDGQTALTLESSSIPGVFALLYQDSKPGGETGTTEIPSETGTTETPSEPQSSSSSSEDSSTDSSSSGEEASDSGSSGNKDPGNQNSGDENSDSHDSSDHDSENDDSSTYVPDYEKEFWEEVRALIQKAKAGETVNVNAVTYDRMPESVMDALRRNPNVALIVRWDGGDAVIIPALTALAKEEGRVYYPLSYLSSLYKTINAALTQPLPQPADTPQITAPVQSSPSYTPTPESMGVQRPQGTQSGGQTQPSEEETAEEENTEPETAAEPEGSLPDTDSEDASAEQLNTIQVSQAQKSPTTIIVLVASAALLILVLILIAVLLTLKKK